MKDYLIVGQGIAGSVLAWQLQQDGFSVLVVDPAPQTNASKVAGGIYNPITGKRWVRTWGDTWLLPYAADFYRDFEETTGVPVRFSKPILRLFKEAKEKQLVDEKAAGDETYASYLDRFLGPDDVPAGCIAPYGAAVLEGGGWVDTLALVNRIGQDLDLRKGRVEPNEIEVSETEVCWQGESFGRVVFCQGHQVSKGPWFDAIPYRHAKGEILTLTVPGFSQDAIISSGIFMLPVGDQRFKVGATYEWHELHEEPTEAGREELETTFKEICSLPFEVVDHQAGIRPIAFDRAPVAGTHPEDKRVCLLNGFGSKGVLYAPYYGRMLIDHLEKGQAIDDKVSVATHWKPERTGS